MDKLTKEQSALADELTKEMVDNKDNCIIRGDIRFDPRDGSIGIETGGHAVVIEFLKGVLGEEFEDWLMESFESVNDLLHELTENLQERLGRAVKSKANVIDEESKIVNFSSFKREQ